MPVASSCSKRGTCEALGPSDRGLFSASSCSKRGTCEAGAGIFPNTSEARSCSKRGTCEASLDASISDPRQVAARSAVPAKQMEQALTVEAGK